MKEINLRKIIKIEEERVYPKTNGFCEKTHSNSFVMFTDIVTKSTGIITKKEFEKNYEKMEGFTSREDNKQLYIRKY